jgi:hypothetical protein
MSKQDDNGPKNDAGPVVDPGGEKDKGGRPAFTVDYNDVEDCGFRVMPQADMAVIFGVTQQAISYRYTHDTEFFVAYNKGKVRRLGALRDKQFSVAGEGSVPMLIWLGKQYLAQEEKSSVDVGGDIIVRLKLPGDFDAPVDGEEADEQKAE